MGGFSARITASKYTEKTSWGREGPKKRPNGLKVGVNGGHPNSAVFAALALPVRAASSFAGSRVEAGSLGKVVIQIG